MSGQGRELNARALPGQAEVPERPIDIGPYPPKADALDLPPEPLEPVATESKRAVASQWQLMRWKFRKHKLAVISLWVLAIFYLIAMFAEVLAPADPNKTNEQFKYV